MYSIKTRSKSTASMGGQIDAKDLTESLAKINDQLRIINETTTENKRLLDEQSQQVACLMKRCEKLEKENDKKSEVIQQLSDRVEALEQYSKIDNLVINGLDARTYASTVNVQNTSDESIPETIVLENKVLQFFNDELGADIKETDISAIHYLPAKFSDKNKNKPKDIIVRFTNRKAKSSVMAKRSTLKERINQKKTPIYLNEHLTRSNATIFHQARQLRKQKLISNTWTYNCKIFIKTNGDTPEAQKKISVNSLSDLEQFRNK